MQRLTNLMLWACLTLTPAFARGSILVIRPDTKGTQADVTFEAVIHALATELEDHFILHYYRVADPRATADFEACLKQFQPKVLILMDHKSINVYKRFQKKNPERDFPPAILLLSVFVEQDIGRMINVVGIETQVQAVTSLVSLRSLLKHPVRRVGVLYRREIKPFIERQIAQCRSEEIELIALEVVPRKRKIRAGLKALEAQGIDALWIPNDSLLLTRPLIQHAWVPALSRNDLPVVVGIEKFVLEEGFVGHFAVVPDYHALGLQAAEWVIQLEQGQSDGNPIRYPVSIRKILNPNKLLRRDLLNIKVLLELDRVVTWQPVNPP